MRENIMSDAPTTIDTPAARPGRAVHIILWVVQVLLALFFAFIGVLKLAGP